MSSKNKKNENYKLPSVDGIDVMGLLDKVTIIKNKTNTPPHFKLEIGVPANNIEKQLKKQNITFDPSSIKKYDKLIKGIVGLKNEGLISQKKCQKLIYEVYNRSINHVYFIYDIL
jgi:hypothetical protein